MAFYTSRPIRAQLGCLALTLVLVALPLAGTTPGRASILTPLDTELVPLGASLQSPPSDPFDLPSVAAAAKVALGPLPSAVLAPNPESDSRLRDADKLGFCDSVAADNPKERSPPFS